MVEGEFFPIFGENNFMSDKAYIHFTENPGMAFGWKFAGEYGKLFLSLFRIIAVTGIGWYMYDLAKKKAHPGFVLSIALIFSGALGNIIDSAFYGMLFSDSNYEVARFLPEEGGYAGFLHGNVVDMFYFPIIKTSSFTFFSPIFNFADAAITAGVIAILIWQKKFFKKETVAEQKTEVASENTDTTSTTPPQNTEG